MARPFDRVVLVFNPHSTDDAQGRARELAEELGERAPDLAVQLHPTEYAGHAREIARETALSGRPLVVSVSGDGGYNEVVNGVMSAGNANDHRRATRRRPLADAIVDGSTRRVDLLRLAIGEDGSGQEIRYAHSYVGLGITPAVALELEKGGKGSFREIVSTVRTFSRFRPFEIETAHGRESFDSLILANIPEMAKYATLSEDGRPDDGRFEVVVLRHTAKWRVLGTAVKAAVHGLGPQPTVRDYWFRTTTPTPMQLDGELHDLDAGTRVAATIAPAALPTVT